MDMLNFVWRFLMKLKNDLSKNFHRAASRALLVFVMGMNAIIPSSSAFAQNMPPPQTDTAIVMVATQADASTPVQMSEVKDLDGVVKQYPFVAPLQATLKQLDADRKQALKEIDRESEFYAGSYMMGKYTDSANGREFVFLNLWNSPNGCSYEGCPLSVFMKDGKDFRLVLETMTDGNISINSTKADMAITVSRGPNEPATLKYNAKLDTFESPAEPAPAPATPAPTPVKP